MSAASTGSTTTTVIKLAIGVACFVGSTTLYMLVMWWIDEPIRSGVAWINSEFGPYGIAVFGLGVILALYLAKRAYERREERQRFAVDRTIHVVPRRKVPKWIWYYVGGMVTVVVLGLAAALPPAAPGQAPRSGTAPALQTR